MSIFHTHTGKQILGALGGMLAASIVYVAWQGMDQASLSARLVETQTISDKVETIQTNAKNLDDVKRRMLERRAQQVAAQLPTSTASSSSTASTSSESSAPIAILTEFTNPIVPVAPTQRDRIQSRIDRQRMIRGDESDGTFHRATETDTQPTSEVQVVTKTTNTLPGSGTGIIILSIVSSGIAGYHLLSRREKSL